MSSYFCHQCRQRRNRGQVMFLHEIPTCSTCNSGFVEEMTEGNSQELQQAESQGATAQLASTGSSAQGSHSLLELTSLFSGRRQELEQRSDDLHQRLMELDSLFESLHRNVQLLNVIGGSTFGAPPARPADLALIQAATIGAEQAGQQCTVCLEEFAEGESADRLPCQHHFHSKCIRVWLEKCGTCPLCRKPLSNGENVRDGTLSEAAGSVASAAAAVGNRLLAEPIWRRQSRLEDTVIVTDEQTDRTGVPRRERLVATRRRPDSWIATPQAETNLVVWQQPSLLSSELPSPSIPDSPAVAVQQPAVIGAAAAPTSVVTQHQHQEQQQQAISNTRPPRMQPQPRWGPSIRAPRGYPQSHFPQFHPVQAVHSQQQQQQQQHPQPVVFSVPEAVGAGGSSWLHFVPSFMPGAAMQQYYQGLSQFQAPPLLPCQPYPQPPLVQLPQPPHPPQQPRRFNRRLPIINPETNEEVLIGPQPGAQSPPSEQCAGLPDSSNNTSSSDKNTGDSRS